MDKPYFIALSKIYKHLIVCSDCSCINQYGGFGKLQCGRAPSYMINYLFNEIPQLDLHIQGTTRVTHELLREQKLEKKPSISIIKSINIMRHNLILHYFLFPLLISSRPRERNQVYFVRSDVISTESFNTEIIKYYQKNLYVLIIYITMVRLIQESKTTLRPTIRYAG